MKALRVSDGIVPIAQFKREAPVWLEAVMESGRPLVITVNGKPAGVLLSPAEFDRLTERERFLRSIEEGIVDADAGHVVNTAEMRRRVRAKR